MAIRQYQRAFNGGEVSPSMFARIDDGKYQTGMALCKNFLIEPQGPIVMRPGFKYVNHTKHAGKKARLIPFNFSISQTMVLELGERYVRFHTQGQTVLGNNGQPYEIETPYIEADLFDIHYVQSADVMTLVHPNYPPKELRRYGATDWRLVDIKFGSSLSAPTGLSASQTINKDVTNPTDYKRTYAVTALLADGTEESVRSSSVTIDCNPYGDGSYNTIRWNAVAGAGLYRVYRDQGGVWAYVGQTDTTQIIDENITPDASITPPHYDDAFYSSKGITSVRVNNGGSGYVPAKYITDFVNVCEYDWGDGYKQQSTGFPVNIQSKANLTWEIEDPNGHGSGADIRLITGETYAATGGPASGGRTACVTGIEIRSRGIGYDNPKLVIKCHNRHWQLATLYRFPLTTSHDVPKIVVTDSTGYGADLVPVIENDRVVSVTIRSGGQNYSSPNLSVVSSTGSGASLTANVGKAVDYPGAVCYYEQRRCFAGTPTRPQMVWMTRSGTESDMSHTLPSQDDNRLRFAIAAQEASRILHLTPLQQMLAMTNTTEYRVYSGGSAPMAPDAIRSEVQAQIGASNVMPVVVNSTVVYAAARGGHVRELGYNWQSSGFTTGDLSIRSAHFFEDSQIVDMTLAKSPDPIVWAAMADGSLLGFTYLPEQAIGGWHKHTTVNGAVESVTVVPEGDEDIVYLIIRRTVKGEVVRYVERMHERKFSALEDAWCVDCGGEYIGDRTTEVRGLTWLEGETVNILADGCVLPQRVVEDGKVTLTQSARHVIVGLPITADLQTLPVAVQLADGSVGMGHMKNVNDVFMRVHRSSGVFVGPDFDNLVEYKQRTDEPYGSPPALMDKEISVATISQWNDSGQICVRQKDPLPLTIVSLCWDLAK